MVQLSGLQAAQKAALTIKPTHYLIKD